MSVFITRNRARKGDQDHSTLRKSANYVTLQMSAKSLENLLKPSKDGDLGDLIRRAREMGELASALAATLPPDLADGIVAANVRDAGELVVICRTSAWASRLRFETESILEAARKAGVEVTTLRVKVSQQP